MTRTRPFTQRANRKHPAVAGELSRLVQSALLAGLTRVGGGEPVALVVERAPAPVAPARLAAQQAGDASARDEARALYERCLERYRTVQRPQDTALDDAGAALACFVAASLQALAGVVPTPGMLLQLERQLGGVARATAAWDSAALTERQFYFEQMAILAVLVADSWRRAATEGPAARAHVQRAARGYLQQLLGLDADRLTLGTDGLSLRVPAEARRAA